MRRLAILIGNGTFPEKSGLASLPGPRNDVLCLDDVLRDSDRGAFITEVHIDEESHTVQEAVQRKLHDAQADDLVLIYYAGHGKLDLDGQLHLAAANTDLDLLQATSFPLPLMKTMITQSRSHRIVLILDCCFSGAAEKAFLRSGGSIDEPLIHAAEGGGIHIFSSTTKFQTAKEKATDGADDVYGEFTSHVIEGIRTGRADVDSDGKITLQELRQYVEKHIKGQRPRYCGLESEGDLLIASNPNPTPLDLPDDVQDAVNHPRSSVRLGIVEDLRQEARSAHAGKSLAAIGALRKLSRDDSRRVSQQAVEALLAIRDGREPESVVVESPAPPVSLPIPVALMAHARSFLPAAAGAFAVVLVIAYLVSWLISAPAVPGGLFIDATPWANVTAVSGADGTQHLQQPVATPVFLPLSPGDYTVELITTDGERVVRQIRVESEGSHMLAERVAVSVDDYLLAEGFRR